MVMPRLLIQELSTKGTKEDHTLVFCHSYVLLSLYQTMVLALGSQDALYIRRKSITSEKDDTCTTLSVRKNITSSLDSALRVCFFFFHNCLFNWLGLTKYSEGNSWAREWKKWTWRRATVAVMYYGKSGGSGDTLSPEMKHKQYVVLLSEIHPKYPRPVNYIGVVIICASVVTVQIRSHLYRLNQQNCLN